MVLKKTVSRRASIYLSVLVSCLVVSTLAMSALVAARNTASQRFSDSEERLTQLAASSALDWAVAAINSTPMWRQAHTNGQDVAAVRLPESRITMTYRIEDTDGLLADDDQDPCRLVVTARSPSCVYRLSTQLVPAGEPLTCCRYDLASNADITTSAGAYWHIHNEYGTNGSINVWGEALTGHASRRSSGLELRMFGKRTQLAENIEFPSDKVYLYYTAIGTKIDYDSLALSVGKRIMRSGVLSPKHNSFGPKTNPRGVYWIDCAGQGLEVTSSRLAATLVVTNVSQLTVSGSVHWDSPQANFPAIIVDGELEFGTNMQVLRESDVGVNLNPPDFPFHGVSDLDVDDCYPSRIKGLVFATKGVDSGAVSSDTLIQGPVLTLGGLTGNGDLRVSSSPAVVANPPPGFRSFAKVAIHSGTTRRLPVDPKQ